MTATDEPQSLQPKLIYLARRNPALSADAFTPRWRQHGALGMSLPRWRNIARYVHSDILRPVLAVPGIDAQHDGIGLIWHRSAAARRAHLADTSSRLQMERDETETFAEPIVSCCLVAREQVLRTPPAQPVATQAKLMRFWSSAMTPSSNTALASACAGHVINWPLPAERESGWGLRCSAVEEYWFVDFAAALRACAMIASDAGAHGGTTGVINVLSRDVLLFQAED